MALHKLTQQKKKQKRKSLKNKRFKAVVKNSVITFHFQVE
jgi:hypothetical protein